METASGVIRRLVTWSERGLSARLESCYFCQTFYWLLDLPLERSTEGGSISFGDDMAVGCAVHVYTVLVKYLE